MSREGAAARARAEAAEPLPRSDRVLFLRALPAFEALSFEETCAIADRMRAAVFAPGAYLRRRGSPIESVRVVVRGRAEVRRRGVALGGLEPGAVAEALVLAGAACDGLDVVATEECLVLELPADEAEELLADCAGALAEPIRSAAAEIVRAREQLGATAGFPAVAHAGERASPAPFGTVERAAALRAAPLFGAVSVDAALELARCAREARYPAGAWLFREGDPSTELFVCVAGAIECVGALRRQRFGLGRGDVVGALDAIAGVPRWYSARVETGAVVLALPADRLAEALQDSLDLALPLARSLVADLVRAIDARAALTGMTAP